MPTFKDAAQLYSCLGDLFAVLRDDPTIGPKINASGLVIRFTYFHPDSSITIDCRKTPLSIHLGGPEPTLTPEERNRIYVDMSMEADVAHQFWLGKVNLVAALTRGTIKAKGPIPAIMKLLPIITPAYKLYPEMLKKKGLENMIA